MRTDNPHLRTRFNSGFLPAPPAKTKNITENFMIFSVRTVHFRHESHATESAAIAHFCIHTRPKHVAPL
jgi:hypothetical protein